MAAEEVAEGENEEGESNYRVSYNMPLHCTGNLHHYVGHKRFKYRLILLRKAVSTVHKNK
jgi:hypothetical protein